MSTLPVRIKRTHPAAIIPCCQSEGAACFDLHALESGWIQPRRAKKFGTGLAFEIPAGHVMLVYSRSGQGFIHGVRLVNCVGVIDPDYRGEVAVKLINDGQDGDPFLVNAGDRIAQAMVIPVPRVQFEVVDELSETVRGSGGFGSTGR